MPRHKNLVEGFGKCASSVLRSLRFGMERDSVSAGTELDTICYLDVVEFTFVNECLPD
jgi:hypothetical protein